VTLPIALFTRLLTIPSIFVKKKAWSFSGSVNPCQTRGYSDDIKAKSEGVCGDRYFVRHAGRVLVEAMREAGLSQDDIAAFTGGNFLRVLHQCLS
jgi:hypothetical protein